MLSFKSVFLGLVLLVLPAPVVFSQAPSASDPVILRTLQQELDRAMSSLSKADPAAYFISYAASDDSNAVIAASNGAVLANVDRHERTVDISVRVGGRELDNTHGENRFHSVISTSLPLDDRADAMARVLWLNTDRMYKRAAQAYLEVKTNTKVRADEEDASPDFTSEKPQVFAGKISPAPVFNHREWEERLRRLSTIFAKYPDLERSSVMLIVQDGKRYFVSSEGAGSWTDIL